MKKFLQTCCYGLVSFILLGIALSGCEKTTTDWKTEMLGSEVYAKYLRDGIEMNNNLAANGMDGKHVKACTEATGRKYDQAWIDCLSSSERDKRYGILLNRHCANVKALVAIYPQIGNLSKEENLELMIRPTTKEMSSFALGRISE
ncbi:MAG: hypothetical protein ABIV51_09500 [Saprospiraceae bacterium]